jgi:hypothetical protein
MPQAAAKPQIFATLNLKFLEIDLKICPVPFDFFLVPKSAFEAKKNQKGGREKNEDDSHQNLA